jgi:hypothetical protein
MGLTPVIGLYPANKKRIENFDSLAVTAIVSVQTIAISLLEYMHFQRADHEFIKPTRYTIILIHPGTVLAYVLHPCMHR